MVKFHSVFERGLIPPKGNQIENKGKWNDLKVRVKWSCLMTSLYFLILFSCHFYSAVMVALIVVSIFYELPNRYTEIQRKKFRSKKLLFYKLVYSFFRNVFFYFKTLKDKIGFLT